MALLAETAGLVRLADRDLTSALGLVSEGAPPRDVLNDLLPTLVRSYGEMGASVAADWYDEARLAAEVPGYFRAIPLQASDRGAEALIGWALSTATDDLALHALLLGGIQRRIADHLRLTLSSSSIEDPAAHGWMRVGRGECEWCRQYLDGEIHYVEGYDFPAHDNCRCSVTPAW